MKKKVICGLLALLLVLGMAGICSYALDESIRTMYKTIPIAGEQDSFEIIGSNSYRENTYKCDDTIYVESECIIECTEDVSEVQITKIKDEMTFEEFFEYQSQYIKENSTFPPVDHYLSKFDYGRGDGATDRVKLKEGKYVVGVICAGNGACVNLIVGSGYESDNKTEEIIPKEYESEEIIEVVVNGKKVIFDVPPQIVNGRTLVPVRGVSEALGANVEWDIMTRCVTISRGNDNIVMAINENAYLKNGNTLTLDVSPQIINSRTLVPIRVIAESYGCDVKWDEANKRVIIEG